ncbi:MULTISPECIES: hypothetical protein [unclassified Bradyrhizobium]|uniref:hypothetical protein n=1 Tax=unclassified Bradyrhizobium TaxID=2631580 RepID=UPI0033911EB4
MAWRCDARSGSLEKTARIARLQGPAAPMGAPSASHRRHRRTRWRKIARRLDSFPGSHAIVCRSE